LIASFSNFQADNTPFVTLVSSALQFVYT